MVQWFCPIFKIPFDIWTSYLQTMKCYDTVFDLNMNIGHYDLYFMSSDFALYLLRSFDVCTSCFQIMKWYDTTFDLSMIVSHCDLSFHGPLILLYIWKPIWHMNIILPDYEMVVTQLFTSIWMQVTVTYISWSGDFALYLKDHLTYAHHIFRLWNVWHNLWPQYDFKSLWPIFHGQWVCPISESPFDIWTSYFQIMKWHDTVFNLNMNVSHCDLYFMVQWFCFISRRIFDIFTYFQSMKWDDTTFDLNIILSHCDLYFMVQWFTYISKTIWHMHIIFPDYEIVWHNLWPQYEYKSLWPIFHGPVILPYIWKIIWQMNIILPDYKILWHNVWPHMNVGQGMTYILWSSDFALYLKDHLTYKHHTSRLWNGITQYLTWIWVLVSMTYV